MRPRFLVKVLQTQLDLKAMRQTYNNAEIALANLNCLERFRNVQYPLDPMLGLKIAKMLKNLIFYYF